MSGIVVVETARLLVRQWVPDDWKRLLPLATDPQVLQYIGNREPWSEERVRKFVEGGIAMSASRGWVLWPLICKDDAELIGFCGFNGGFPPDVEIGWWLRPAYWGRGLATEAATAVMDYGFTTFGFPRLISVAQPANKRSLRVMEKLGMVFDRQFTHEGIEVVAYAKPRPNEQPTARP